MNMLLKSLPRSTLGECKVKTAHTVFIRRNMLLKQYYLYKLGISENALIKQQS